VFALLDRGFQRPQLDGITTSRVGESSNQEREETGGDENESKDANDSSCDGDCYPGATMHT